MTTHSAEERPDPEKPDELRGPYESGTWDKVDQAAWESFPASDPPGHAPQERVDEAKTASDGDRNTPRRKMLRRLGRELFQTETSARLHCRREAARLGSVPPSEPLRAAARHASEALKSMREHTAPADLPLNVASALIGVMFSTARELVLDRVLSSEQSYRGTLLGMKHGVDLVKMMNELAQREGDAKLAAWTDAWLRVRESLVLDAEARLSWFADHAELANKVAKPLLASTLLDRTR